jgi:RNA polymerase sigma-70 factor (ECF subfamily)
MNDPSSFAEWMARVRAGDEEAATELVRQYERAVRVAVRVKLTDPALRNLLDSMDICQSVMHSFFVRAAVGQYDLECPAQLVGLLVKMARNKLCAQARKHAQIIRDVHRNVGGDDLPSVAEPRPGPAREAAARELLSELLDRLAPEERELARRRATGQGWNEIAVALGGTPDGHRMRLARAVDRLAPALGLDDGVDFDE